MALYRFLFAPALLVVALVAGSGERARPSAAQVTAPQAVRASHADADAGNVAARGVAVKPAARPVPHAERARAHPAR
jgi:hypothetical protein